MRAVFVVINVITYSQGKNSVAQGIREVESERESLNLALPLSEMLFSLPYEGKPRASSIWQQELCRTCSQSQAFSGCLHRKKIA